MDRFWASRRWRCWFGKHIPQFYVTNFDPKPVGGSYCVLCKKELSV